MGLAQAGPQGLVLIKQSFDFPRMIGDEALLLFAVAGPHRFQLVG